MQIEVEGYLGAVARSVEGLERGGRPARKVVLTRIYETDAEHLWDALTSAERLPRWFLKITGDLRAGGRYQLEGNAEGEILKCDAPRHLAVTWEFGGKVSWVDVRIADAAGGARLTLEHVAPVDEHWEQFGPGATGVGWDLALLSLALYQEAGADFDPQAVQEWTTSDAGKSFMRGSSDDWGRAAVAAGADVAEAQAAARRTTDAYTGEDAAGR